jgi:hypothetical protein
MVLVMEDDPVMPEMNGRGLVLRPVRNKTITRKEESLSILQGGLLP